MLDTIIKTVKDILSFLLLNSSHAPESASGYLILLKVIVWGTIGFIAIYIAYKLLGKFGAIVMFIFGLLFFVFVNDLLPI